ncbi:uncharacterized protein LOC122850101 [Aphidius gifuensis]|uniref:uncharacterized protein LOC122850101 n=1 Tax=Aphidius gifuensis TaxID=684658 RepID=UPI001CDD5264|nr:uncharacterized protein LOC122850101 [Aphidius gifuensis]
MTWPVIFCILLTTVFVQANENESPAFVESKILNFSETLTVRIFNNTKNPHDIKNDIYRDVLGIIDGLGNDHDISTRAAVNSLDSTSENYELMIPCIDSLTNALYDQYKASRNAITDAMYAFENFTRTKINNLAFISSGELLKRDFETTIDSCYQETINPTQKCDFAKLNHLIMKMEEYLAANDDVNIEKIATEIKIKTALKEFHLFSMEINNLVDVCRDIFLPSNKTTEKLSDKYKKTPFELYINLKINELAINHGKINSSQLNSLLNLDNYRSDGLTDINQTYNNLTSSINKSEISMELQDPKKLTCNQYLQENIFDSYTSAYFKIEKTHILYDENIKQNTSQAAQVEKDLKTTLELLKKSRKQLAAKRKLSFFQNVIDQVKKIGTFNSLKDHIEELGVSLAQQMKRNLDLFYARLFGAFDLQNICLDVNRSAQFRLFGLKTVTNTTKIKQGFITKLDNLIHSTIATGIDALDDFKEHSRNSLSNFYTALENILTEGSHYPKFKETISECIKYGENTTIDAYNYLNSTVNRDAKKKYIQIGDETKSLLENAENLQKRLIDIEKECMHYGDGKEICLNEKFDDINERTEEFNNTAVIIKGRSFLLRSHYKDKIAEFRKKIQDAKNRLRPCIHNYINYYRGNEKVTN